MSDDELQRIEDKLDKALELTTSHEVLLNHPETGIVKKVAKLETARLKLIGFMAGLGTIGGGVGAKIAKIAEAWNSAGAGGPHTP